MIKYIMNVGVESVTVAFRLNLWCKVTFNVGSVDQGHCGVNVSFSTEISL